MPEFDLNSSFTNQGDTLVVTNATSLLYYDLNAPENIVQIMPFEEHEHLLLCEQNDALVLAYTSGGVLRVTGLDGAEILQVEASEAIRSMTCAGSEIAYVTEDRPTDVNMVQIGVRGEVSYAINASAPIEEDDTLAEWGTPVDMENATVENIAFDREYLAVTVNVSATDRLVLYNRSTAGQWLASNPKFHVSDISLDHGILAWSVRDHYNPLKPQ